MIEINWPAFKDFVDRYTLTVVWVEQPKRYLLYATKDITLHCIIKKNVGNAVNAFENNYKG